MKKIFIILGAIFIILVTVFWIISEKSDSYPEPYEAILAVNRNLTLMPAYKVNDEALYFFLDGKNALGTAYVKKGLFGWKAGMLTWSPINTEIIDDSLSGYQIHEGKLIYGLIKGDDRRVEVNGNNAYRLYFHFLPQNEVEKLHLEDVSLWFYESSEPLEEGEIKLFHSETDEELAVLEF